MNRDTQEAPIFPFFPFICPQLYSRYLKLPITRASKEVELSGVDFISICHVRCVKSSYSVQESKSD